jgi:hypothetical protein
MPAAPQFVPLAAPGARTTSGNGDAIDLCGLSQWKGTYPPQLLVQSDVTAVGGTSPVLTLFIEDSIDGGVTWNTIVTFATQNAVSRVVNVCGIRGDAYPAGFRWPFNSRKVRARWTITGTGPSVTFSVKAVLV